jgi:uncharacterized protein YcbX
MKVSQLWSYPVKSMLGNRVNSVNLTLLGIESDRQWAIRDLELGGIRGAKKIGALMQFAAERDGDHVRITCPDGTVVSSADADVSDVLSSALGRTVVLEPLPEASNLEHFRRGPSSGGDMMEELRNVFGRDLDEPLPDFSVFPPEVMEFESPPGAHHDCWPLMVMTESAMEALRAAVPDSAVDVRRFRPSMVIDDAPAGHPEFGWKGRSARIGWATVEFLDPCPRCVMVTRRISDELPEDRAILRHIVRDLDQCVGVYARVMTPGVVNVGDALEFL